MLCTRLPKCVSETLFSVFGGKPRATAGERWRFPSTKRAYFSGGKFEGKIEGKITDLTFPILIALLMEETLVLADSLHSQNARERTRNSRVVAGLCECLENKVNNGRILRIVTISLTNLNMCCLSLDPQIVLVKNQHFCVNSL